MGPVIERVPEALRHRGCPRRELVVRFGVARAAALRHTVGAHGPPLVVIALQPDFEQVGEAAILGDVARRQVAVIVQDRLICRVVPVKPSRRFGLEEKIVVNERHRYVSSASLQYWRHFAHSVMRSDPAGTGYSNSIVA